MSGSVAASVGTIRTFSPATRRPVLALTMRSSTGSPLVSVACSGG